MFCGAGLSSRGASDAGVKVVGGVDLDQIAIKTFQDNFPKAIAFNQTVEDLSPAHIMDKVGKIDLLLASPECTNHSCARGARPKIEGSRETALQVWRFAKAIRPRWIVIENVVHMRPWDRYAELIDKIQDLGYDVREHVIDAADFGVPQRRRRLFLLCDLHESGPVKIRKRPGPKPVARSILDCSGTWPTTPLRRRGRAKATLQRAKRAIDEVGQSRAFLLVYYGSDGAGGFQSLDVPLRTITTLDRFALVEPARGGHTIRMLQVPELARAMGLNDHLLNRGSRRDRIKMLGNGVCSPVMEAIVSSLCRLHHR